MWKCGGPTNERKASLVRCGLRVILMLRPYRCLCRILGLDELPGGSQIHVWRHSGFGDACIDSLWATNACPRSDCRFALSCPMEGMAVVDDVHSYHWFACFDELGMVDSESGTNDNIWDHIVAANCSVVPTRQKTALI